MAKKDVFSCDVCGREVAESDLQAVTAPRRGPGRPRRLEVCTECAADPSRFTDVEESRGKTSDSSATETSPGPTDAGPKIDLESFSKRRVELVQKAVKEWMAALIDLGGRNNLLHYRDLRRGTLDLTSARPEA